MDHIYITFNLSISYYNDNDTCKREEDVELLWQAVITYFQGIYFTTYHYLKG